jgi:uncharacterized phage protein (TIGR01671 family)
MRIKFRAWDKSGGEVMLNVYAIDFFLRRIKFGTGKDEWRNWDDSGDITLMQFTGLLDKNGKEIYEGDIIFHNKMPNSNQRYKRIIEFYNGCFGFIIKHPKRFQPLTKYYIYKQKDRPLFCEVIGNIYDNPELLEGGAK